jgi:uncharacterized protein YegL
MNMRHIIRYILMIFVVIGIGSLPAPSGAVSGPAIVRTGGARNRIEIVFEADQAPSPGGTATLSLEATPLIYAPDLQIEWFVPPEVELLGTAKESFGAVAAHQTVTSQREVRFQSEGIFKVGVWSGFSPTDGIQLGSSGVLFFTIVAHGSKVSDMDPQAQSPMGSLMPAQVTVEPMHTMVPSSSDSDPCFAVNGTITRIDREPTASGYAPDTIVPVRYALVEIREEDVVFDDSYGEVLTNENGYFSFAFCDDDGWGDDTLEIYVRLWAEIYSDNTFVAEVIDTSWIDEVYEIDSPVVSSGGGTLTFDFDPLNETQSAIFNIADAVYEAWAYWKESGGEKGGDALFDQEGEVHWEPGYGEEGSYYISFWEEITIADHPSQPDQWDDSVIIHEWGHMADDRYSCDDNPGGQHSSGSLIDPELAWGEGYPDYWQSAVRAGMGHTDGNYYLDLGGTTKGNLIIDLESWNTNNPHLVSDLNEMAVAAALWDLNDEVDDGQDRAKHGHAMIQGVYTSETFEDIAYGFWDDTCEFDTFIRAWVREGNPTDLYTAGAIRQNTGYWIPPSPEYVWWDRVTQVVDNSASMAGAKFDAVKTILAEIVNDLGNQPKGTEFSLYSFHNQTNTNIDNYQGFFFPDLILPEINKMSTVGFSDPDCQVEAFRALSQAVENQYGGDVWLFTDGEPNPNNPTVETLKQLLNTHAVRASIALLGVCSSTTAVSPELTEAERVRLDGASEAVLGLAAADTPDGLVPYLLTAINSGGQFLFVDSSQLGDAAEILRAQISHSAGAGRWSDYVSDNFTYSWDRLSLGEFNWIDATTGGTEWGNPPTESYLHVALPQYFSYFNGGPYLVPHVYENGYITFGDYYGEVMVNTPLPNPAAPNNALYPYWDNLEWVIEGRRVAPAASNDGYIYTKRDGDWFAIEYYRFYPIEYSAQFMTFEVLLNLSTGEIRYLYETAPDGAGSATIGLENAAGSDGIQVSYNDVYGAANATGYKFTPMPPQPNKTYRVEVDSLMDEVYFLLTGYSGSFGPLKVYYPDGSLVNCADSANVVCLDLDLVQYVQVKVNNRVGEWQAVVDAGSTGSGTYSFHSNAASAVGAQSMNDRSLSTSAKETLLVKIGQALDGNTLTGRFRTPNDQPFGSSFSLYDDGLHADGLAADGLFGSDPYTPAGAGTGYLYVEGQLGGTSFVRSDPIPFTFQPVEITSLGDGTNSGGGTELQFEIQNLDTEDHCYWYDTQAPEGWWIDGLGWIPMVCINAGESHTTTLTIYMASGETNNLPSGTNGEVTLTVTDYGEGLMSDSATAWVTRHRAPASINIYNPTFYLRPGGDSATLEFIVLDDEGMVVADGTEVQLSATLGSISPSTGITHSGFFSATFTSGSTEGTALITANFLSGSVADTVSNTVNINNNVSATTEIDIGNPKANQISLEVSPQSVPPDGVSTSNLVATVKDRWGMPVADQVVRIGVSGDGQIGRINGSEVVSGTTNTQGQFTATFTSGTAAGEARVRAELLVMEAEGYRPVHEDQQVIDMILPEVYLPLILR